MPPARGNVFNPAGLVERERAPAPALSPCACDDDVFRVGRVLGHGAWCRDSRSRRRCDGGAARWTLEHYFGDDAPGAVAAAEKNAMVAHDAAGCRVRLSASEQRQRSWSDFPTMMQESGRLEQVEDGRPRSEGFCHALQQFLHTGACWLESDALPADTVSACRSTAMSYLETLRTELSRQKRALLQNAQLDPGSHRANALLRCDFAEITERDGGRLDMRYRMNEPPFCDPSVVRPRRRPRF